MKIGFVGGPGSGKTVLAAKLYARLLELGLFSTRLVPEYAQEFLGSGGIIIPDAQITISNFQRQKEEYNIACGFSPIICDSAIWLGAIYMQYNLLCNMEDFPRSKYDNYIQETLDTYSEYDYMIYVPLFDQETKTNEFRVHDNSQSTDIDHMILKVIEAKKNSSTICFNAPEDLELRDAFVDSVARKILESHQKKQQQNQ